MFLNQPWNIEVININQGSLNFYVSQKDRLDYCQQQNAESSSYNLALRSTIQYLEQSFYVQQTLLFLLLEFCYNWVYIRYIKIEMNNNISMKQQPKSSRYNSEDKTQKFMEIISKQLNIKTSQQKQSNSRSNRIMSNNSKIVSKNIQEIYSQIQLPRQRRGASFYKLSARDNNRTSKSQMKEQFFKDSAMNFYQGLMTKNKYKDEETVTVGHNFEEEDVSIEQIHYQMVKVHQDVKKMPIEG